MLYTIEEETLTALGEAVRKHTICKNESDRNFSGGYAEIQYYVSSVPHKSKVVFPNTVKKMKVILHITHEPNTGGSIKRPMPVDIAPGHHDSSYSMKQTGQKQTVGNQETEDVELIINSNCFSLDANQGNGFRKAYVSYEAIALDEDGKYYYTPLEMIDKFNGFNVLPNEGLTITGNCSDRFANNGWNWFIDNFGDKITTKNISAITYCFENSTYLKEIPFDLNINSSCSTFSRTFESCSNLKEVPYIIGPERSAPTGNYSGVLNLDEMFNFCDKIREIPEDYFWKIVPNADYWEGAKNYYGDRDQMFHYCYSLRKLPDISMLASGARYSSCLYYNGFGYCISMDEIINLPVITATFTSNGFVGTFERCSRLKNMTFETNEDGTAKTANWKSQVIDFSLYVGYVSSASSILNYNSGITADKQVKDDATYQALKNDPDWFSTDINYSRYNHDSAVNTINSLPDCSAYGTNTIKFMGTAGALTDGGAINTLTEEEIAVATAKGWTVSLV